MESSALFAHIRWGCSTDTEKKRVVASELIPKDMGKSHNPTKEAQQSSTYVRYAIAH